MPQEEQRFVWTNEFEEAFPKLKEYLVSAHVLGKPVPGTRIHHYFAITNRSISSIILQDQDKVQKLVYFVTKVLQGPKTRFQAIEKVALAVVFTAW